MSDGRFKKIGEYFKAKREARGLTQEEVARFLGYSSKQIVSNWERGVCSPPLNQVSALIRLFGLNESEVVEVFLEATREELKERFRKRPKSELKMVGAARNK